MPGKPPRGRSLTEADKQRIRRIYAETASMRAVSRAMGIHDRTVLRVLNEPEATVPIPAQGDAAPKTTKFEKAESSDGSAVVRYETTECVKTLEDAIRVGEVDLTQWKVDSWVHKSWTVQMNVKAAKGHDEAVQVQQHGITLKLSRIVPKAIHDALDAIYERMADYSPNYGIISRPTGAGKDPCMALFCLFDIHFGKLAWNKEAHDNYDLRIAEAFFDNAVEDLLNKSTGREIAKILMPLGSDFFHINSSAANTTAAGTPQDVDGRYAKIVEVGEMAFIRAVERLMRTADVDIPLIKGNHDPNSAYHTARTVHAWFRSCGNVNVDTSPKPRKYRRYGCSLVGITHGDKPKPTALPGLMAQEEKQLWAETTCRHCFIGHLHHSKEYQTMPVQTHEGVVIHQIRSLAGSDNWHTENGFVNLDQGAEVYYFGKKTGYDGHNVAYARLEEELKRNAG